MPPTPSHLASPIDAVVEGMDPFIDVVIHAVVDLPGRLDLPLLRSALDALAVSQPVLACHYHVEGLFARWIPQDRPDWPVEECTRASDDEAADVLAEAVATTLPLHDALPLRLRLVHLPDRDRLLVTVSHLLVDAGGTKNLLYALAEAVRNLRVHPGWRPAARPFGPRGYGRIWRGLLRYNPLHVAWGYVVEGLPMLRGDWLPIPMGTAPGGRLRSATLRIPAHRVARLKARGSARNATLNDLLVVAMGRALATCFPPPAGTPARVGLISTADLRRTLPPEDWFANLSALRVLTVGAHPLPPLEACLAPMVAQTSYWKRSGRSLGNAFSNHVLGLLGQRPGLRFLVGVLLGRVCRRPGGIKTGFTNMGPIDAARLDFGAGPALDAWLIPPVGRPPFLMGGVTGCAGNLHVSVGWVEPALPRATAERVLDVLNRELGALA